MKKEETKTEKVALKIVQVVMGVLIVLSILVAIFDDEEVEEGKQSQAKVEQVVKEKASEPVEAPKLPAEGIRVSIETIKEYGGIKDLSVEQSNRDVTIGLMIQRGVTVTKARELGDNLIRQLMVNSNGVEDAPKKEIGMTTLNYRIVLIGSNEEDLGTGMKEAFRKSIKWY